MRRFSMLGLALVAMLALFALATTAAFGALPEILPKGTWTGKNDGSGKPILELEGGEKIECQTATASGADSTDSLGTFHIDFERCLHVSTKHECHSLGDLSGIILVLGEYHFVWDTLTELGVAVLFLPEEVHLECPEDSNLLIVVKPNNANGGPVCLILEPASSKVSHLFHCEQSGGRASESRYWNDEGKEVPGVGLTCTVDHLFTLGCGELALAEVTYKEANAFMTV